MLKGCGWRKGQECAHSWHKNHPLGFIGRGKVTQIMWPGMEARLRKSNGQLDTPAAEAVDVDGTYTDREGIIRKAILNRLRFGQDGGELEGGETNELIRSLGSGGSASTYPTRWIFWDEGMTTRVVSAADETDQFDPNLSVRRGRVVLTNDTGSQQRFNCVPNAYTDLVAVQGDIVVVSAWVRIPEQTNVESVQMHVNEHDSGVVYLTGGSSSDIKIGALVSKYLRFQYAHTMGHVNAAYASLSLVCKLNDGGSLTLDVVGPQIEKDAAFASSWIPTDGATATRAGDHFRFGNVGESIAKAAQGTVSIRFKPNYDGGDIPTPARMFSLGSTTDGVLLSSVDSGGEKGKFRYEVFSGGGITGDPAPDTLMVRGTKYHVTVTWELDSFRLSVDGKFKVEDISGAAPTAGAQWVDANAMNIGGLGPTGVNVNTKNVSCITMTEPVLSTRQIENLDAVLRRTA